MDEGFNKWVWKLAYNKVPAVKADLDFFDIELLIKAMWAINRDGKWEIGMNRCGIRAKRLAKILISLLRLMTTTARKKKQLKQVLRCIYKEAK